MIQIWLLVFVVGVTVFGIAMSVASKPMTWAGMVLALIGALGIGYYFYNGEQVSPSDPPDVSTRSN